MTEDPRNDYPDRSPSKKQTAGSQLFKNPLGFCQEKLFLTEKSPQGKALDLPCLVGFAVHNLDNYGVLIS